MDTYIYISIYREVQSQSEATVSAASMESFPLGPLAPVIR